MQKTKKNKKSFKMPKIKTANYDIPIWVLPIAPFLIACDKFHKWNYDRQKWNEEKATKVINYWLLYVLEFAEEDNAYYFNYDWRYNGYNICKRVPVYLKRWTNKFGYDIVRYLRDEYENENFSKSVEKDVYGSTWIKFENKIDI